MGLHISRKAISEKYGLFIKSFNRKKLPVLLTWVTGNPSVLTEKYQFLPLMLYSVYCALGNICAFTTLYLKYTTTQV